MKRVTSGWRFRKTEIEEMKRNILTHCQNETDLDSNGNKSAWRLRCSLEGMVYCALNNDREYWKRKRKVALFEMLTNNDMPNFAYCLTF